MASLCPLRCDLLLLLLLLPPSSSRLHRLGASEMVWFCSAHLPGDLAHRVIQGKSHHPSVGEFHKSTSASSAPLHQALLHRQRCCGHGSVAVALDVRRTMMWKHVVSCWASSPCMFRSPFHRKWGGHNLPPGKPYRQRRCHPLLQGDRRRDRPTPPAMVRRNHRSVPCRCHTRGPVLVIPLDACCGPTGAGYCHN